MKNGLYSVSFAVGPNAGSGVAVITDGKVQGGDAGFAYLGHIDHQGGGVTGQIAISQHRAGFENVFAGLENFQLTLSGKALGEEGIYATGETLSAPGATIVVEMKLIAAD